MQINGQNLNISLGRTGSLSLLSDLNLKDGQKVLGRIISLSADQAVLNLAGRVLTAQLEGNPPFMTPGAVVSFQVNTDAQGKIQLKVLNPTAQNADSDSATSAFEPNPSGTQVQSPDKGAHPIINALLKNDLPVLPENIAKVARMVQTFQAKYPLRLEPETAAFVLAQKWPATDGVLLTALLLQDRNLRNQLWNTLEQTGIDDPAIAETLANLKLNMEENSEPIFAKLKLLNTSSHPDVTITAHPGQEPAQSIEGAKQPQTGIVQTNNSNNSPLPNETAVTEDSAVLINALLQNLLNNELGANGVDSLSRQILSSFVQERTELPATEQNVIQTESVNRAGKAESTGNDRNNPNAGGNPQSVPTGNDASLKQAENVNQLGGAPLNAERPDTVPHADPVAENLLPLPGQESGTGIKDPSISNAVGHSAPGKDPAPEAAPQKIFALLEQNLDLQKALNNQPGSVYNLIPLLIRDSQNNLHECFVEWRSESANHGKTGGEQHVSFIIPTENMGLIRLTVGIGTRTTIGLKVETSDVRDFLTHHADSLRKSIAEPAAITISLDPENRSEPLFNGVDFKL